MSATSHLTMLTLWTDWSIIDSEFKYVSDDAGVCMARPQAFNNSEVLHRAMDVFWHKGYEATSLKDLLSAMGLSKSSLYSAFGGKRELFLTAFDAYRSERAREMHLILGSGPARDAIEKMFRKIVLDVGKGGSSQGCMSINQAVELAPHDPEVRERVMEDFALIEHAMATAIIRGQADGTIINKDDARKLARLLVLAFPGLQVMRRAGLEADQLEDALQLLMSTLD